MPPEGIFIHQRTTPTTHLHYAPALGLVRVGYSPDLEVYLPPEVQSTFHLPELTRACGHIRLPRPPRLSK